MYSVGDKIIYGESGVCTVEKIAPLTIQGAAQDKLYYYLTPLNGTGTYFTPVDSNAFMRCVISKDEAIALIDSMPKIEPAICNDNRFNHVDSFYKDLFKQHSCEALVSVVKGLSIRLSEKKTKSSRAEIIMKRAREMLHGELSVALDIPLTDVDKFITSRIGDHY